MHEIIKALKVGIDIEKKRDVFYSKAAGEVENPMDSSSLTSSRILNVEIFIKDKKSMSIDYAPVV